MPQTNILSSLRSYLCCVSGDASDVVNRTGWVMLLALLFHPEVGGKSEDDQTKTRHEGLLCYRAGNDGIRIAVEDDDFKDLEADHDKANGCPEKHCPFALEEYRSRRDYHPTTNDCQENQAWDGIVTERCALQPVALTFVSRLDA
jgi:hypothetical protein